MTPVGESERSELTKPICCAPWLGVTECCVKPPPVVTPPPPTVECALSPSCPPDMYNVTAAGYAITPSSTETLGSSTIIVPGSVTGCTLTPPAASACVTTTGATATPAFSAPNVTKVVIGGGKGTVYAIGTPSVPLTTSNGEAYADTRAAVFAWGDNSSYQLGTGSTATENTPVVPYFDPSSPVVDVAAGAQDACALLQNGQVYCWGEIMTWPTVVAWTTAHQVAFPAGVTIAKIAHGQNHACALTQAAAGQIPQLYCWGNDDAYQLGTSIVTTQYTGTPILVPLVTSTGQVLAPSAVAASGRTTCVVDATTTAVFCWGDDTLGSVGDAAGTEGNFQQQPTQVAGPVQSGFGIPDPVSQIVAGSAGSTAADAGYGSFCALDSVTSLWWCWGADDDGQIDLEPSVPTSTGEARGVAPMPLDGVCSTAQTLAIGPDHGCGLVVPQPGSGTAPSSLLCFGDDDDGQLGLGATGGTTGAPYLTPVQQTPPSGWTQYAGFAVGDNVTCAFAAPGAFTTAASGGNLACWGELGGVVSSSTPTPIAW